MSLSDVKLLYAYDDDTFIENVAVRPNGHVLCTPLKTNQVLEIDPTAERPQPKSIAELPGCKNVTGIARIGHDTYAVSGGTMPAPFKFEKGSLHIYTISFDSADAKEGTPVVKKVADVSETEMLNGMCSLPGAEGIILSADSITGRIFRVNTRTGAVDVAFQDDLLAKGDFDNRPPCGVNGIKVRDGHLYWTNSAYRTFGRVPITKDGDKAGEFEYFTTIPEGGGRFNADDDFDFDESGAVWVARHPGSLVKIDPKTQEQTTLINADSHGFHLHHPTSTALDHERNILYMVTGGAKFSGGAGGGQIVKVQLK